MQRLSRKKKLLFSTVTFEFSTSICYLGATFWRCHQQYKQHCGGQINSAYAPDANYGYFPRPRILAYSSFVPGEKIPVAFDENGFRIPEGSSEVDEHTRPTILFLGCSFTHGYGVLAEKTFAWLAADAVGAKALNAAGSGWGVSQMVLRARDEIPRLRPDIVVVQYSNWLPERSTRLYGPTHWALSPTPYFYQSNENVEIHPPVFQSAMFHLNVSNSEQQGLLPFVWKIGLPLCVHDDFHAAETSVRRMAGLLPAAASPAAAVSSSYSEIQTLCDDNDATMVVLGLSRKINDVAKYPLDSVETPIVDTLEALKRKLPRQTDEAWDAAYAIWGGSPSRIVNRHPNERMHAEIADVLTVALQSTINRAQSR